jgi:putative transposase
VVHLLRVAEPEHGRTTTMKRHRHTPEQIVRKLRAGEQMLNESKDITEVLRHLEVSESTWNRWRNQYGGMKADGAKRFGNSSRRTPA